MWITKVEYECLKQLQANRDRTNELTKINIDRIEKYWELLRENEILKSQIQELKKKPPTIIRRQESFCRCGNLLYEMVKTNVGGIESRICDPRAFPSKRENRAVYCVCPECGQINKHRFGGSL